MLENKRAIFVIYLKVTHSVQMFCICCRIQESTEWEFFLKTG